MSLYRFMLDTNALSGLVRQPMGAIARKVDARGIDRVCTSVLTASELRYGAVKSQSHKLQARVDQMLSGLAILPFESPADRIYAQIRSQLAMAGSLIGPTDMFIAAHALTLDLVLVTANVGEFSRVPGLTVENWLD